ncbi:MAG: hypothetical protein NZ561_00480 [Phycisphaerae bacterium]|nr:hypothetical protein [Phycisphaerae bacterium]MDW8261311.1 hypothetical protein [Phycisphaerales bacterium]
MKLRVIMLGGMAASGFLPVAHGQFVPSFLDIPGTRIGLPGEGYLVARPNPLANRFGDEYTGWIDIRHPARVSANLPNFNSGYDMSDHQLRIRTTTLTDSNGVSAAPNIARDFHYANRIWGGSQAGLSVIQDAHRNYTSGGANPGGLPVTFTFPPEVGGSSAVFDGRIGSATNNLTGGPATRRIDMYYVADMDDIPGNRFRGYAFNSSANTLPSQGLNNPGDFRPFFVVATTGGDTAVADTFAHEIGHFLLNGPSVDNPSPGDPGHSATKTNLMASGSIRWYPGQPAGDLNPSPGGPPSAISSSILTIGKTMRLNTDGTPAVGGIDQLTAGNGTLSQVRRVFDSTGNSSSTNYLHLNRNAGAGDRVDFDFMADVGRMDGNVASTDVNNLDGIPGADNFPGTTGERLYFGIGSSTASDQTGKDKTGLGTFNALPDYAGAFFKYADVFSLSTMYSDSDINPSGDVSTREGSLDYNVQFRDALGNVSAGVPTVVFTDGWSLDTSVDNFVCRWVPSDPNFNPVGLFIIALEGTFNGARYDAACQIDAVVVGIPEPAGWLLAPLAAGLIRRRRA